MQEQVINTGDPAMDQQIAADIKQGMEAGGMTVEIVPAPGGGVCIRAQLPAVVQTVAAAAAVPAAALEPGRYDLGGTEGYALKQQALMGDLAPLRAYLKQSRAAADWDDRYFMIDCV